MATDPEPPPAPPPVTTLFDRLAEPFPADCVEWRAQTVTSDGRKAMALAYIDARSVMIRMDEVLGPENWRDSYRHEGGRMICKLELRINGEWLHKEDGSGDSQFEGEKGGISGALKRAAVKWGIGRYLYDVDALWVECESYEDRNKRGKWIFKKWTRRGEDELSRALSRFKGARVTGKPSSVEFLLGAIADAETVAALRDLHSRHWSAVPLDYRKEVLEALDRRKADLNRPRDDDRRDD